MNKPWFRNKKYGYGWGFPQTWQGWLLLIWYLLFMIVNYLEIKKNINAETKIIGPYITNSILATFVFLFVVYITSEKPKWRWGDKKSKKATNCIIHCIDFRFQKIIENWIYANGMLENSDLIALAGGSKDFVKPVEKIHKENWLRELATSVKLHKPETIIVIDHQDCGGYSSDNTIASGLTNEQDKNEHAKYLSETKKELAAIYPNVKIRVLYVDLAGVFTEF